MTSVKRPDRATHGPLVEDAVHPDRSGDGRPLAAGIQAGGANPALGDFLDRRTFVPRRVRRARRVPQDHT